MRTASLPFACGIDGGCSNRVATRNRVGRRRELGNAIRSVVILSRVGQGRKSGGACRSRSTGNRIHCPARSLLACVEQEGSYGRHNWGGGGVTSLVCHGRARRGRVCAGARSEQPGRRGRRGSVARHETQERRGLGLGVGVAATVGVIALRARWAVRTRAGYGCEGSRLHCRPRSTERRSLLGTSTSRRQGIRGPRRPRSSSPLPCNVPPRETWGYR